MSTVPDDISKGIGLGKQLVDLLSAVKSLGIKRPEPNEQKEHAQQLIQDLGEWAAEAYPKKKKLWLRPILRADPFVKHLKDNGGYCEPQGECTATFGWAKLLYALNIRPGAGVVSWESLPYKFDPVSTGVLPLEMEGPVLWHIINLYRLYDVSDPRDKDPTVKHGLSFGTLSYKVEKGKFIIAFEPGEMANKKEPFRYNPHDASLYFEEDTGYLRFDRDTVMTLYLENALRNGISDPSLKLPNPHTELGINTPLDQRIRELVRILKVLRAKRDPPTDDPYLVTDKWLKQATRIYRRATSQGSTSPTLPEFMVSAFENHADPNKIQSLNARFGYSTKEPATWRTQAKELLQTRCMLPNHSLHQVWRAEDESESTSQVKDEISRLIREEFDAIMKAFKSFSEKSLMRTLAEVPEEAKYLLAYPRGHEIQNKPGIVLEFTPADEDWKAECQVQC